MWELIQHERHNGYYAIGYVEGFNEKYGCVAAMYQIGNYDEVDFYYHYKFGNKLVKSFENWVRKEILKMQGE